MDNNKFYLATAIAYTSGKPHIGNMYETILADAITRYKRLQGFDVFFQTGTDEHGQKIEENAKAQNMEPKEFVDKHAKKIQDLYHLFNIQYDNFVRTTDDYHVEQVQKIFQKLYDQGDIYKGKYEGWYCVPDESFWTESQLVDGNCPDCGRPVEKTKEETYFFRLSKYQKQLEELLENNPDLIVPKSRKNEMMNNFIKPGIFDLSVTRSSFDWGIQVPFDKDHVVYVWIDALSNYITGLGYDVDGNHKPEFKKWWPADLILIGKDIVRFHTIYWPILLMALGLEQMHQVFGHPWLLVGEGKMSKSMGNAIYPDDLVNYFGVDPVRYAVLKEMPYANDGVITYELLIEQINNNLANVYGNLVNRTISMVNKYFDGSVSKPSEYTEIDKDLIETYNQTYNNYTSKFDQYKVAEAMSNIVDFLRRANKYIDETQPWILAKEKADQKRLNDVLYNLLESVRLASVMLLPIIPDSAAAYLQSIGALSQDFNSIKDFGKQQSYTVVSETEILFARIDKEKKLEEIEADQNPVISEKDLVKFEDFTKLDITVGKVLECKVHPDADRLLVSQVDVGTGVIQIVSGITDIVTPEDLIGQNVITVINLEPIKLRGVLSEGMLLVAKDKKTMMLLNSQMPQGSKVE
ncbi:MAG: methionine--tRNA ligase [Erysipelothrix sp.]|nr:methionine--tRNA ligase [Erysipelothrix sp.]